MLGLVRLVIRILFKYIYITQSFLAELARLYGGTGSKSLRLVSARNAFFGNILCLSNFRESVHGRRVGHQRKSIWSGTKTLYLKLVLITRGTDPAQVKDWNGLGPAMRGNPS